jgi:hypothetical protein
VMSGGSAKAKAVVFSSSCGALDAGAMCCPSFAAMVMVMM